MFSFIRGIIIAGLLGIVEARTKFDRTPGTTLFNSDISGIIAWVLVLLGVFPYYTYKLNFY
ncbi:MAG: hypothetical protein MUO82_12145 [Candidatus Thermoplasmatota archaeon]|nr:hypothetical protein [Candidatus Thermoplasmatota archaeon]